MSDIIGLHSYYQKDGTDRLLAAHDASGDGDLFYNNAGTWTVIGASANEFPTGSRVEMVNFIDTVFLVGATTADSPSFVTTASMKALDYTTSTNLSGAPNGRFIVKWRDLLWILNYSDGTHYPNRVFFSDAVTAGAIAWTATNWIEIDADDGDQIRGGGVNSDRLIIWKEFSMYKYDQNDMIKIADVGTTAHRSIKNLEGFTFFFNRAGVFRYAGGQPVKISGSIEPYINGMTSSPYNVCAEVDDDYYRLYIGTTVVNGVTHSNVWLNYSLSQDGWSIDKTPDLVTVMCNFVDGNDKRIHFGTSSSTVYKKADKADTVYSDQYVNTGNPGVPIEAEIQTKNFDMKLPELKKFIHIITLFFNKAQGVRVSYSIDKGQFKPIRGIIKPIQTENFNGRNANFIGFKISESSSNTPFKFEGLVINADIESQRE